MEAKEIGCFFQKLYQTRYQYIPYRFSTFVVLVKSITSGQMVPDLALCIKSRL